MIRHVRLLSLSIGLLIGLPISPLHAGLITFNVDLSGVDEFIDNALLRVYGTLTVDPDLPITAAGIFSSLTFQRDSMTPILLPSTPEVSASVSDNLAWSVIGDMLFINRTGHNNANIIWEEIDFTTRPFREGYFRLGSGLNSHKLYSGFGLNSAEVVLKAKGPPDGPYGFLIGTVVPEPASLLMLTFSAAVFPLHRRPRR